jgi:hypothetical protein
MAWIVIKILLGLFVWMVLPTLIYKKRKYKKYTPQHFVHLACAVIGMAILVYAAVGLVQFILSL